MNKLLIEGMNFSEMEAQKYYSFPSTWAVDKKKTALRSKIFSGKWYGAEKKDGYFAKIVKADNGDVGLFSRSRNVKGEFVDKKEWVPQLSELFNWLPKGSCLIGELYLASSPGSSNVTKILGCLKEKAIARQEAGEKLRFYVFDVLAWDGASMLKIHAIKRFGLLSMMREKFPNENGFVEVAEYSKGEELWNNLQQYLDEGKEGIVIVRDESEYHPGKRPSLDTLKVKKELRDTLDVVIMGANPPTREYTGDSIYEWEYYEDMRTGELINERLYREYLGGEPYQPVTKRYFYAWAGSLKIGVYKNGKLVQIGSLSGLSDDVLNHWQEYVGMACEITAMELTHNMRGEIGLRHPKLVCFRPDLDPKVNCTWDKI